MATFSFTISASKVNSLKGVSNAAAFEAVADRGLSRKTKHNVLTAKFGDGYEQRVLDGINTKQDQFSISFNNRPSAEVNLIAAFLDDNAGKSFDFVITDKFSSGNLTTSTIKVVCDDYSINYGHTTSHNLSCELRRVYEP